MSDTTEAKEKIPPISVVVCAKNEAERIEAALLSIRAAKPAEIVVVDGMSSDDTVAIAERYADKVIRSDTGCLTGDRQVGIDNASHDFIAMIDADHRIKPDDLVSLWHDLETFGFDVVQAQIGIEDNGFWCRAENDAFDVFLNSPGEKSMIGTAPAMYRRRVFADNKFDATITRNKDDADFFYRLHSLGTYRFGHGHTKINQKHFGSYDSYKLKFAWYGRGDAEFCRKHPNRAGSMKYHLFFRYPVIRSLKALVRGKPRAVPYFVLCGLVRGSSMLRALKDHKHATQNAPSAS